MTKPKNNHRQTIQLAVGFAVGATAGYIAYTAGFRAGIKYDSLTKDLIAHQMIVMNIRAKSPELIDTAVKETVDTINGLIAAAN